MATRLSSLVDRPIFAKKVVLYSPESRKYNTCYFSKNRQLYPPSKDYSTL